MIRCLARRVVIENGRATGVEIERGGRIETVRARREVILAASSINSPKLLMLSGIGPGANLAEHGIEVVADRPGVGANLQDHLELYIQQECLQPITLYSKLNLISKGLIGLEWLLFKSGDGTTNHFESAAFLRSKAGVEYPDIQYHFLPVAIRYDGKAPAKAHGFQAHVGPMRSPSRGRVKLTSNDPKALPSILFNYMSDPQDWADFRHCIRVTREILGQQAFDEYCGAEILPGAAAQTDDELDAFAGQLDSILGYVGAIQAVDVTGVTPTGNTLRDVNVTRPDDVRPGLTQQQALAGAPSADDGRFAVPQILGEEA